MTITIDEQQNGLYRITGDLVFATIISSQEMGEHLIDKSTDTVITLDFKDVGACDSAGIAMLVAWARFATSQQKQLHFINLSSHMLDLTRVSGLDTILPIKPAK